MKAIKTIISLFALTLALINAFRTNDIVPFFYWLVVMFYWFSGIILEDDGNGK